MSGTSAYTSAIEKQYADMQNQNTTNYNTQLAGVDSNIQALQNSLGSGSAEKLAALEGYLKEQSAAGVDAVTSQLASARDNQLTQLQKALDQSIADGELSVRDAERMFEQGKQEIDKQNYLNSQQTNLTIAQNGLGNSAQGIGMMQGDMARTSSLHQGNRSDRDFKIANIRSRIDAIKNQTALDMANTNNQYDLGVAQAQAQANSELLGNVFNMQLQDYNRQQEQAFNLGMYGLQSKDNLTNQYNQNQMGMQQALAEILAGFQSQQFAHQNNLESMAVQQGYTQENMAMDHQNNISMANLSFEHDKTMSAIQFSNQSRLSQQEYNQSLAMANQQAQNAVAQEQAEYEKAVQRELSKYTPGSKEYQIREGQLRSEVQSYLTEVQASTMYEAMAKSIYGAVQPTDPGKKKWYQTQSSYDKKVAQYQKDLEAWNKAQAGINVNELMNNMFP